MNQNISKVSIEPRSEEFSERNIEMKLRSPLSFLPHNFLAKHIVLIPVMKTIANGMVVGGPAVV